MTRYMFTRDETNRSATSRHILRCDEDPHTGTGTYALTREPIPDNYDGHGTHISRQDVARIPADQWQPVTLDDLDRRNIVTTRHVPSYWQ